MALTFDHAAKLIGVPQADAAPLLVQVLVNAIREEEASERGIAHDQIADASGKEALGSGVTTGITLGLRSTWMLAFEAGAYQATVAGGNIADALARVQNTGSPQVVMQSSVATTLAASDGSTGPTEAQIAAAVWAYVNRTLTSGAMTPDQAEQLDELHRLQGLRSDSPLIVTPTSRVAGGISQQISEAGGVVTVSRL